MSYRVDPQTLLFDDLTLAETAEVQALCRGIVLDGRFNYDHPALRAWLVTNNTPIHQELLLISTAFPQRALLSIVERDARALWAHCVSEHAVVMSPETSLGDLLDYHRHEHEGPGTIRDHSEESRAYSLKKLGEVLSEAEPENGA